jgi:tetratricopeptide (TPR) repeat protein
LQASQRDNLELRQRAEAAAEAERLARLQAQKRLEQIGKALDILSGVFRDLDPRGEEQGCGSPRARLLMHLDRAAELLEKADVGDALTVARLRWTLGHGLLSLGSPQRALVLLSQARKTLAATLGPDHSETLSASHDLALAHLAAGQPDQAVPLLVETLKGTKVCLGANHPRHLAAGSDLGLAYQAAGKLDLALPLLEEILARHKAILGPDHPDTLTSMVRLALAYDDARQFAKAEALFRDNLDRQRAKLCPNHRNITIALILLSNNLLLQKKADDAEPLLRKAVAGGVQYLPHLWQTYWAHSLLGAALLGQHKYADAERPLLDGFAGMKQRADEMPAAAKVRLVEAAQRLVELYEAWQRPEDAARWRKELLQVKGTPEPPLGKQP